jgi:hypothetical protein
MRKDSTAPITLTVTQGVAFMVGSASLAITLPDGTLESSNPSVSIPEDEATSLELSAQYAPSLGGLYQVVWTYTIGAETFTDTTFFWSSWIDVHTMIRNNLGLTLSDLPDDVIGLYLQAIVAGLLKTFPSLGSYETLAAAYRVAFDTGSMWLLCASVRTTISKSEPTGEIVMVRKGTTLFQYANPNNRRLVKNTEDVWEGMGWDLLRTIPEIAAVYDQNQKDSHGLMPTRGDLDSSNLLLGYGGLEGSEG